MKFTTLLVVGIAVTFMSMQVSADDTPNINYGMWETTTTTSMTSDAFNMPETTQTYSDCVTEEQVREGQAFIQDMEQCEVLEQSMTKDSMEMNMTCSQPQMGEMKMNMSMKFDGNSSSGTITGEMQSPMGKMLMNITLDSRRTGDC